MREFPLLAGVVTGAAAGYLASKPSLMPWPTQVRAAVIGACAVKVGVTTAWAVGGFWLPRPRVLAGLAGVGVVAGVGGTLAARKVLAGLATKGRTMDTAFAQEPMSAHLSTATSSWLDYRTVGREGARFLHSVVSAEDIEQVTGQPAVAEPVRVFVGVASAPTVQARVDIAMAELERTGAFERSTLIVEAPAGTGYANPTPISVVEVLLRGDVATVAVSYGLLPSFLSLGKVPLAAQTQAALLAALRAKLATLPRLPRLLVYGESLGARVLQTAIPAGFPDLDINGIDGALWVGTPGGKLSDVFHAEVSSSSVTVDRPEQLPDLTGKPRPRVWFLEHDGDPIVHNRPRIAVHRPAWLTPGEPRGRNVPPQMSWVPGITWLQVLIDTFFASNVKPGLFESRGHDYRADLGAVVTAAYDLPAGGDIPARLEEFLRKAEVTRAAQLGA